MMFVEWEEKMKEQTGNIRIIGDSDSDEVSYVIMKSKLLTEKMKMKDGIYRAVISAALLGLILGTPVLKSAVTQLAKSSLYF